MERSRILQIRLEAGRLLLDFRNALMHSAETICDEVLYYETERTQILLKRLIVKLLGCQESDWASTFRDAEYLSRMPM